MGYLRMSFVTESIKLGPGANRLRGVSGEGIARLWPTKASFSITRIPAPLAYYFGEVPISYEFPTLMGSDTS